MCGILGLFPGTRDGAERALELMAHRGNDSTAVEKYQDGVLGFILHAQVGHVPQPLHGSGVLVFNGEIYNWCALKKAHNIHAENDSELLLHLLDRFGVEKTRSMLDGVYAYAYITDESIVLERDLLGVKPLWYATEPGFAFASEKKALLDQGYLVRELHPRTTLTFVRGPGEVSVSVRPFVFPDTELDVVHALRAAVRKRIPDNGRVGVLFSGGIDSALLALLARDADAEVTLYVAVLDDAAKRDPHDLVSARESAETLGLPLVEVHKTVEDVEALLPELCARIEDSNVVKVGVALPFWFAAERAAADGQRVMLSGLGAEEVFAGYQRHRQALDINQECVRGLRAMHERDLYRDDVVGMSHTVEFRVPFLDAAVVAAGLAVPGEEKILDGMGKMPLRRAAMELGLPEAIAFRPKRAAQYGSQFDAALEKLAKRAGTSKSGYLRDVFPVNARLCALLSGGKDSVYALHTMLRMNYAVSCCATVVAENPHSYMYHTPLVDFTRAQAESMGFPLLTEATPGEKEEELDALRAVLLRAKEEFNVDGVVSGALFSDYQRQRIEWVCEDLGLRVYAPLWHLDQEQEVREVLDAGFSFVFSRVAADGLDRSWVGRPITHADVDVLKEKLHLNVAGEGGEFETLVVDGPLFSEPIDISGCEVVCEGDGGSADVCELRSRNPS